MAIYQIVTLDRYQMPTLQSWRENPEDAEAEMESCKQCWPEQEFWIEQGTHHITQKCRGCETLQCNERYDAHGITTGLWCESCYNSNEYPYRRDKYPTIETHGHGETLGFD